jgi:hypothetical protein
VSHGHAGGFSIGSLGRDKAHPLDGEGSVNCLLSRDHRRLFVMHLSRLNCAADESGPSPHVMPYAFNDRVLDPSILHVERTDRNRISFPPW